MCVLVVGRPILLDRPSKQRSSQHLQHSTNMSRFTIEQTYFRGQSLAFIFQFPVDRGAFFSFLFLLFFFRPHSVHIVALLVPAPSYSTIIIIVATVLSSSVSVDSFPPPLPVWYVPCVFVASKVQHFLPSSTRSIVLYERIVIIVEKLH